MQEANVSLCLAGHARHLQELITQHFLVLFELRQPSISFETTGAVRRFAPICWDRSHTTASAICEAACMRFEDGKRFSARVGNENID